MDTFARALIVADAILKDGQLDSWRKERYACLLYTSAVMAYDFYAQLGTGSVPGTMLARLGGSYRMRGYYEGRYRDRQMVEVQAELRQHIYNRHGVAVWVGAGNVFPTFGEFNPEHTLPSCV